VFCVLGVVGGVGFGMGWMLPGSINRPKLENTMMGLD